MISNQPVIQTRDRKSSAASTPRIQLVKKSKLLRFTGFLAIFTIFTLSGRQLHSAEAAAPAPVPAATTEPSPRIADEFKELLTNSPFTRALNLSDVLALTGVAEIDGKPVLTLLNRTTRESYLVSDEPNAQGWRLVEIYPAQELGRVEAKISAGPGQVVSVRFDEKQLKPEENKPSKPAASQNRDRGGGGRDGGERRGPDPEMMKKYNALTQEQQQRFREIMREQFMKNRNMSSDERREVSRRALEAVSKGR